MLATIVRKGGTGSGHHGHAGRPGKRGGSTPEGGGASGRVWTGEQQPKGNLSKLQTGEIGEALAMRAMEERLGVKFSTLNEGLNNAPIDVAGNHHAIEVKTGLASNGKSAQKWRATIGQPGKAETELLKRMSKEEKQAHNQWKGQQILNRKNDMLKQMEEVAGAPIKPATVAIILAPDGSKGDVFFIPGFHLNLTWKQYATDEYHIGTYDVGDVVTKGGAGSGHHGHAGRPGKRGGSLPGGTAGAPELLSYLNQVADLKRGQKREGFKYAGPEDMVLKHGKFFTPPKKGAKVPEGCEIGEPKECFRNSIMAVVGSGEELIYTEGFAASDNLPGFGFAHAWLTTKDGQVVDLTWSGGDNPPPGTAYFGIQMDADFVMKTTMRTGMAGIIINDWMDDARLMKNGFPEGAMITKEAKLIFRKGGAGSGHHGHAGRPGKRGGSAPGGGSGGAAGGDFNAPTKRSGVRGSAMALSEHARLAEEIHNALPQETKDKIAEVEKKVSEGTQTVDQYRNADGTWQPEREALHNEIIQDMMGDTTAVANPEVLITGGLPGSGKSTVLRMRGEEFTNHVHVDSDAIKARLPEYKGWNAGLLHEESSHVAGRLMEQSISGSRNVIYDATLKTQSSAHKIVDSFTDIGYKSKIVFVDAPMETAMNRAVSRFMGPSGRYVPLGYLATHDHKNAATVDSLKGKVDSWEHWDSSESPPKLVATGGK